MYGRLRVRKGLHTKDEIALYRKYYCGLCFEIKKKYGWPYRFLVNYDIATAYMVATTVTKRNKNRGRCFVRPYRSIEYIEGDKVGSFFADLTVILAFFNAVDDMEDGEFNVISWFLSKVLKKRVNKIAVKNAEMYNAIKSGLTKQSCIEREKRSVSLLESCSPFGDLLGSSIRQSVQEKTDKELLRILFYWIGCWIYLIDACDDVEKDLLKRNYNPLITEDIKSVHDIKKSRRNELIETLLYINSNILICLEMFQYKDEREIIKKMISKGITSRTMSFLEE